MLVLLSVGFPAGNEKGGVVFFVQFLRAPKHHRHFLFIVCHPHQISQMSDGSVTSVHKPDLFTKQFAIYGFEIIEMCTAQYQSTVVFFPVVVCVHFFQ